MKGNLLTRTDNDSWDITESVGATALGVAAGRAAETKSEHSLISDPYAQLFLDADVDVRFKDRMRAMTDYTASRTRFFDEFFMTAAADGIAQAVILAAGLDARV